MMKIENANPLREFLLGNDSIMTGINVNNNITVLTKIPYKEGIFGVYAGTVYDKKPLRSRYDSKILFYFFKEEKTILFVPESGSLEMLHAIGEEPGAGTTGEIQDFFASKTGFNTLDLKMASDGLVAKYKDKKRHDMFAKYPSFDSIPIKIQELVLAIRKKELGEEGEKRGYTAKELRMVLKNKCPFFLVEPPYYYPYDYMDMVAKLIKEGEQSAIDYLFAIEREEYNNRLIASLAVLYKTEEGMENARKDLSGTDKQEMAWYK